MKKFSAVVLVLILLMSFALRLYKVFDNPPGLYIDEAAIGYNGYQILTTGKDEYGKTFPLFFESFGDYKPPIYVYATSISMLIFGKNEFAIRFPSVFFGSLTIFLTFLFVKKLIELDKTKYNIDKEKIALLAAFLLSISPWHIHFSRGGFETNLGLFIFMLAFVLFLYFFENKKILFASFSFILFALTPYAYHSYRIITPIMVGILAIFYFFISHKDWKKILVPSIAFLLLVFPIFIFTFSPQGAARFSATSAFTGIQAQSLVEKFIFYPSTIIKNYLSYFSVYFLFDTGDGIGRHQIPNLGLFFKWQLPFLLIGLYSLLKMKNSYVLFFTLSLLLIAPIPASLVVPSPHSLRSLLMVIPLTIMVSFGIVYFLHHPRQPKKLTIVLLLVIGLYEFVFYVHHYYVHYPKVNSLDWGAGYKEIVVKTLEIGNQYDEIILDKNLTFAPIYYKFYSDRVPKQVDIDWVKPSDWSGKKVLYIRPFYGKKDDFGIIYNVSLPKNKNYIFAQFWSL